MINEFVKIAWYTITYLSKNLNVIFCNIDNISLVIERIWNHADIDTTSYTEKRSRSHWNCGKISTKKKKNQRDDIPRAKEYRLHSEASSAHERNNEVRKQASLKKMYLGTCNFVIWYQLIGTGWQLNLQVALSINLERWQRWKQLHVLWIWS